MWRTGSKILVIFLWCFMFRRDLVKCEERLEEAEKTTKFWKASAQFTLQQQLAKQYINGTAKNVIFFLGDGMSIPTITAARIYSGQLQGQRGEEAHLAFDRFPFTGFAKTYCIDRQVSDSACTATAYLCGVKANYYTIGVNGHVKEGDCRAAAKKENRVESIAAWAQKAGKGTGIVTTTRITHASPAGTYAHTAHREHESDSDIPLFSEDPTDCRDIASQLIQDEPGRNFNVIFGGGRSKFLPSNKRDESGTPGNRSDGVDLISVWQKMHGRNGRYITSKKQLKSLNLRKCDHVLGLFASSHLPYNLDANPAQDPSLSELTEIAIKQLSHHKKGYFLFVEGGRIDHAHHETRAVKALDETVQFSKAIQTALDLTQRDDTLIIVSADHSHTMSMNGYPYRGKNILGPGHELSEFDNMPYMTLSYANGPGVRTNTNQNGRRIDPRTITVDKNYQYPGVVPLIDETHGGDDVAVFAIGPYAHLFVGTYEQNVIPEMLAYASCIGDGLTACNRKECC